MQTLFLALHLSPHVLSSIGMKEIWRKKVSDSSPSYSISLQGEKKVATIQNVFAVIRGLEEPDRYILLGNHRDAWTYGAVDPHSGTAALLDIARRYALMMRMGWNPRRSIILCSWDAEEFGMVSQNFSLAVVTCTLDK